MNIISGKGYEFMLNGERLYKEIASQLKQQLFEGVYKVGEKLPTERQLAEKFKVGRTVIREALIFLEIYGFIEIKKSSGIYVLKTTDESESFINSGRVGPFELLQARQLIESNIAALAAKNIVKNDLEKLYVILEKERALLNSAPNNELDHEFHIIIAGASQNNLLVELVKYIWDVRNRDPFWQSLTQESDQLDYSQKGYNEHKAIFMALQKKDAAGARQSMWQHIENIKNRVSKQLESESKPEFDRYFFDSINLEIDER